MEEYDEMEKRLKRVMKSIEKEKEQYEKNMKEQSPTTTTTVTTQIYDHSDQLSPVFYDGDLSFKRKEVDKERMYATTSPSSEELSPVNSLKTASSYSSAIGSIPSTLSKMSSYQPQQHFHYNQIGKEINTEYEYSIVGPTTPKNKVTIKQFNKRKNSHRRRKSSKSVKSMKISQKHKREIKRKTSKKITTATTLKKSKKMMASKKTTHQDMDEKTRISLVDILEQRNETSPQIKKSIKKKKKKNSPTSKNKPKQSIFALQSKFQKTPGKDEFVKSSIIDPIHQPKDEADGSIPLEYSMDERNEFYRARSLYHQGLTFRKGKSYMDAHDALFHALELFEQLNHYDYATRVQAEIRAVNRCISSEKYALF